MVFGLGLLARLAWLVLEPATAPVADERTWLLTGVALAERHHFDPLHWKQIFYPPLFPYLVGLAHGLGGMTLVALLQVVSGSLLVLPVGRIGDRLFGARAGTAAAAFVALYPEFVWHSVHFWAEPLYVTLLFWAFERVLAASDSGAVRSALGAGVLFGLATLTREPALYFVPATALWMLWRAPRPAWKAAAVLLLATGATLAPWTLRNWLVYRAVVPVSIMSGRTLWEGNTSLTHDQVFRRYRAVRGRDAVMRQYRVAVGFALENIRARQPGWFFEKTREQMPRFWAADNLALIHMERGAYSGVTPTALRWAGAVTLVPYLLLLAAFAIGAGRVGWSRGVVLLLAFLLYYCCVHVAVHGHPRFRLPVTPVLMLIAAGAFWGSRESRARWTVARGALSALLLAGFAVAVAPSLRQKHDDPAWGYVSRRDPKLLQRVNPDDATAPEPPRRHPLRRLKRR